MNLNDVKVVGNLVKEPEVRYTPKGTPVANISLGVNETYSIDDEKRKTTTFVDVSGTAFPLRVQKPHSRSHAPTISVDYERRFPISPARHEVTVARVNANESTKASVCVLTVSRMIVQ